MDTKYFIHIFAFVLSLLMIWTLYSRKRYWNKQTKIFSQLIVSNMILLGLDVIVGLVDGANYPGADIFNYWVNIVFFAFIPFGSGWLWFAYVDQAILQRMAKQRFYRWIISTPLMINTLASLANLFYPVTFVIDANNHYQRGPFYWVLVASIYCYYVLSTGYIIRHHHRVRKEDIAPLIVFPFPALIAGVIEIHAHLSVTWPAMSLTLMIIFVHFLGTIINTDHLTRVANRFELDKYLENLQKRPPNNRLIAGFMVDINGFKQINDLYGHQMGDIALSLTANSLQDSVRKEDFVARYGGDEFVIFCLIKETDHVGVIQNRIRSQINHINQTHGHPFVLNLALGAAIFDIKSGESPSAFINRIDLLMYEEKRKYIAVHP